MMNDGAQCAFAAPTSCGCSVVPLLGTVKCEHLGRHAACAGTVMRPHASHRVRNAWSTSEPGAGSTHSIRAASGPSQYATGVAPARAAVSDRLRSASASATGRRRLRSAVSALQLNHSTALPGAVRSRSAEARGSLPTHVSTSRWRHAPATPASARRCASLSAALAGSRTASLAALGDSGVHACRHAGARNAASYLSSTHPRSGSLRFENRSSISPCVQALAAPPCAGGMSTTTSPSRVWWAPPNPRSMGVRKPT